MPSDQDTSKPRALIFQSYGWRDASEVAQHLARELRAAGYEVWIDRERIREHTRPEDMFPEAIRKAIKDADVVLLLMSPHSVRLPGDANNPDKGASVCLNELVLAHEDRKPIVPVVVVPCEAPFLINIVRRIDLSSRTASEATFHEGVAEILSAIETVKQRGSSIFIPQLERLHPLDFRNEVLRGVHDFAGRDWLFERLQQWLAGDERCLVIEGDAGSGKSAIVSELVRRDPQGRMLAYHFCRADQIMTVQPAEFVRSLAAMIGGRIEAYGAQLNADDLRLRLVSDSCAADPLTALMSCVVNPLVALAPHETRYIVVDALDEAMTPPGGSRTLPIPQLLARALADFPPWLRLVVTMRRHERLTALFQNAAHIALRDDDSLQRQDVVAFLVKHFETGREAGEAASSDDHATMNAIEASAAGNFLYARQVAEAVGRGEIAPEDIHRLPSGLAALFSRIFQTRFPDARSYEAADRVLGAILAAKEPLTAAQIAAASELSLRQQVLPVLDQLTGYVVAIVAPSGETVYGVFHKSLADWLVAPPAGAATFKVDPAAGRARLIDWCRDWRRSGDPYALAHTIAHLLEVGRADEALAAVRAGLFAKRDGRMVRADLEDTMALVLALLERGEEAAVIELATGGSPWRRDGAAAALIAAPKAADVMVDRLVGVLLGLKIVDSQSPTQEEISARRTAIRVSEAREFDERLMQIAHDKAPTVRITLATMIYRHWVRQRAAGWRLIERLAGEMLGFLSLPDGAVLEVLGHASLAILNNHLDEHEEMTHLRSVWRGIAQSVMRGPIVRVAGSRWSLSLMMGPLVELMKRQPAYQPFNTRELAVTFARNDAFRADWRCALDCLEKPEMGVAPVVAILTRPDLPFDLYLMLVIERVLICHGHPDLAGAFETIEMLFHKGKPWFRQSALYVLFHLLQRADHVDDDMLARYGAMTSDFFASSGATMRTSVAEYSFSPHLAWPEIVAETQRRGRGPWLLPGMLGEALAEKAPDKVERVFKAIDLVGFAYSRSSLALSLIERVNEIGGATVEARIVESLANVRFHDEALVDEFLERSEFLRLKPLVKATSPSIKGEDIPTWVDGFMVQSILTSPDFHREVCNAFRRALGAHGVAEFLKQILVWVIGLLSGEKT